MKLRLFAPVVCAAAIAFACGGKDDNGDNGNTGGESPGTGGNGETGSGGDPSSSGGNPGSGGDSDGSGGEGGDASGGEGGGPGSSLTLASPDFDDGEELPDDFTCEGKEFGDGISPQLSWSGAPEGTETYALVFADTTMLDAGLPRFGYHWVAWNIPEDISGLPKNFTGDEFPEEWDGGQQFRAGPPVDHDAFFGPCPSWQYACENATPRSNDSYAFILYTFDDELDPPEFDDENFETYAHQLAEFFAEEATDSTRLTSKSDAAPGVKPTVPACPAFAITSPDFDYGEPLPDVNTCEGGEFGDGVSPKLDWTSPPEGTTHYALVFMDTTLVDLDLPQFGYHWAAWNIPVDVEGIPANMSGQEQPPALEGGSQFRAGPPAPDNAFFGPCPSWQTACENGTPRSNDSYAFILYAYDGELDVPAFDDANYDNYVHQLDEFFAEQSPLGRTGIIATSDAAPGVKPTVPACPAFAITSPDFGYGDALPDENTCEGEEFGDGVSPELNWTGAPTGTTHYALVFADTTLVNADLPQFGYHWAAWNIPVSITGLEGGLSGEVMPAALGGGSQYRAGPPTPDEAFFGPCPSWQVACDIGAERSNDTYQFILYAYDGALTVPAHDTTNYPNYVHQLDEFFASQTPLGKTALEATSDAAPGEEPTVPACPAPLSLSITGFTEGGEIPDANTCEGKATDEGVSPAFSWVNPSAATETYAIVMRNEDLNWTLWAAWDIPSTVTSIAADVGTGATPAKLGGGSQVSRTPNNDPPRYYTPCPSRNEACESSPDRTESDYSFTLYTFNEDITPPNPATNLEAFATYLESNAASSVTLNVTSDALPECDD